MYDQRPDDAIAGRRAIVDAADGTLVGYYCTGEDARVPGLAADDGVVDLGLGMAPDLVGRGHGESFATAVLDDVRRTQSATALRAVIQTWNSRSLALARRIGFVATGTHRCGEVGHEVTFTILIRHGDS